MGWRWGTAKTVPSRRTTYAGGNKLQLTNHSTINKKVYSDVSSLKAKETTAF